MSTSSDYNLWQDTPAIPSASPWDKPTARQALRTVQIIVGVMVASSAVLMGVVVFLGPRTAVSSAEGLVFTYAAIGAALTMLAGRAIVPSMVDRQALRAMRAGTWQPPRKNGDAAEVDDFLHDTGDAGRLCLLFVQHTVIGSALIEGPVMFLLIAYLFESAPVALATAAIMLSLLAAHFPTRTNAERWVERHLDSFDSPPAWGA